MVEFFPVVYEVPSPPRRGYHRPSQSGDSTLGPLNSSNQYQQLSQAPYHQPTTNRMSPPAHQSVFYGDKTSGLPPLVITHPLPNPHEAYVYAPTKLLDSPQIGQQGFPVRYSHASPPPLAPQLSSGTLSSTANTSLALIRQLNGGTAKFCVEQSIRESYERSSTHSASCQSIQKRCRFPHCLKISVSRGLCRGHGGGRRCHVVNCTKSAQSRSTFCWTHGGGKRCEVEGCMRSRKSKRFCVAHLHHENVAVVPTTPLPSATGNNTDAIPVRPATVTSTPWQYDQPLDKKNERISHVSTVPYLPSLGEALSTASRVAPHLPIRRDARPCAQFGEQN